MSSELYDAEAPQRVRVALLQEGEQIEVTHVLRAPSDEQVLVYVNAGYTGNEDEAFAVGVQLWNELIDGAEGYEDAEGNAPTKLALIDGVDAQDKFFAVENGLLATRTLPVPKAQPGRKFVLGNSGNSAGAIFKLGVFNNGQEIVTTHILRRPTTDEYRQGQAWLASQANGTARAETMAALYDKLKVSVAGYANRVPVHHKVIVVLAHLRRQQQLVMGK